jgi:PAS domain S-box-containing protein
VTGPRTEHECAVLDVLWALVRHPDLLREEAFSALSKAFAAHVAFDHMALFLPDGDFRRLIAVSDPQAAHVVRFGARIPAVAEITHRVYVEKRSHVCADTRLGSPIEVSIAESGFRSYISVPIRSPHASNATEAVAADLPVIGELVFVFRGVDESTRAPLGRLEAMVDAVGAGLSNALLLVRSRRLEKVLDGSGDALLAWDRERRVTDLNAAMERLSGRSRAELLGLDIATLLDPLPNAIEGDGPTQGLRLDLVVDGRRTLVAATFGRVQDDAIVYEHALLRDLTEVARAEALVEEGVARVRDLEEQLRTLLDNAPLMIFRFAPDTRELVYLNRYAEHLLGVPTSEALATPGFLRDAHADGDGKASFDAAVRAALAGRAGAPYEARLRRRSEANDQSALVTARGVIYPRIAESGAVVSIEGIFADVTAEQAARTRLIQNDRLATLGTIAAGVAHEINNPAAFILLGLDMLDRTLRAPGVSVAPSASNLVGELRSSIQRVVDIAGDLRLFASPPGAAGRRTVIDVNRAVESALGLVRGQLLERAQIVRELGDVPSVIMEDGRLGQVVVNLLVNAAQAIPKRERALVPGVRVVEDAVYVATRADSEHVIIEVRDTGEGIAAENLERIFEPFFTTKGPEIGTGLGLSISRDIVKRTGGRIEVESPPRHPPVPRGTVFRILLPITPNAPASSPVPVTSRPAYVERRSVLVVEDEPALARVIAITLEGHHDVHLASDGQAALVHLEKRRFDVVLCDLRMPGMGGEDLYAEVTRRDPAQAARFIFMTGVGFGTNVERFLAASGRPFLEKPFVKEAALAAIERVCDRAC